jgi:transglutaminase-like putative cysteine protease
MQCYKIVHHTYYNFSSPVALGTHELLLRPREDHTQRIQSFNLRIRPDAAIKWHRDVEGNSVAVVNFKSARVQQLAIESEVIIQQHNEDPLDFIVSDYALNYPFNYQADDAVLLTPYRMPEQERAGSEARTWVRSWWQETEIIQTYALLLRMAQQINNTCTYRVREEPGVQTAKQTLEGGTGSCRDFAFLFMQAAQSLGLAARFVSGYLHAPYATGVGSTHAWAEIYLPGAGWLGFDPTIGDIVGADHFPVAVAHLPESVPPVSGTFRGAGQSTLDVGVWVSRY